MIIKLPSEFSPESKIFRKLADSILDEINDQAMMWAAEIPEFAALIPTHLEDEEVDEAIDQVTSQIEEMVYKALASRIGIKL